MAETTITCPSGLAGRIRGTKVREPRPIHNYSPAVPSQRPSPRENDGAHTVRPGVPPCALARPWPPTNSPPSLGFRENHGVPSTLDPRRAFC